MYINPFAAGVLSTIFIELLLMFVWAVIMSGKEGE